MQSDRAREHLEVIRTLMERSAVYRRALAPTTLLAGALGTLAALVDVAIGTSTVAAFLTYWLIVALVTGSGALLLIRRQALKAGEPFWSPPTRRVASAATPPLAVGLFLGLLGMSVYPGANLAVVNRFITPLWVILYGCALHSAGFFMPRGMRLFGVILVSAGCAFLAFSWIRGPVAHFEDLVMGTCFGGLHLAYGIYLRYTEPREPAA
ncbi:MAG: hypothetical protein KDM81_05850 [Verrucomicrobiae bacterium]|nr:hypothetical protein [Verrucomicrobiae bacterium]MCP5520261.1 hypothetical protein [Verrucomicrobiales bacterium]